MCNPIVSDEKTNCNSPSNLQPSDAIYAYCIGVDPQKMKYGICIDPDESLFFVFNSKCYKFAGLAAASLEATPEHFSFLKKKCYLDTGQVVYFNPIDVNYAINAGNQWAISDEMKKAIKTKVHFSGLIKRKTANKIKNTF